MGPLEEEKNVFFKQGVNSVKIVGIHRVYITVTLGILGTKVWDIWGKFEWKKM